MAGLALALACRASEGPAVRAAADAADSKVAGELAAEVAPDFAELAARMSPTLVSVVSTLPPEGGLAGQRSRRGVGSGLVVRADGQVLTNLHVIADALSFTIGYADGTRVAARTVYSDGLLDLALIAPETAESGRATAALSQRRPRPGEWVMAIGHPFGLGDTVTVGVISGLGRDHEDLGRPEALDPEGVWSFIQTDASVNLGNSGGPLVDLRGEVLGLTTAVRSDGQGVAFAVPAAMARKFLDEVWAHGRFRHARLGVEVNEDDERPGVWVVSVAADGPGERAGLRPGDLLLTANDEPLRRVSDLAFLGRVSGVGEALRLSVRRGEGRLALELVPDELVLRTPAPDDE